MNDLKFQIFKNSANAQYYYKLKTSNRETVLSGEGYMTKQYCIAGINAVKSNAQYDNRYERRDANSSYTFNIQSSNGEIVGRSEIYRSSMARESGIAAVKRDASTAPVEHLA